MNCKDFREIADSYLSDELLVETNHEVLRHLETCADCRQELNIRREWRETLRSAVRNAPQSRINEGFMMRLRANLRTQATRPNFWEKLSASWLIVAPTFAVLLVLASLTFFALRENSLSNNNLTATKQTPLPTIEATETDELKNSAVKIAYRELAEKAVGDHENCALKFNLAEKPISLREAAAKFGKFNQGIDRAVINSLRQVFSDKVEFLEAHSCVFGGKRFAHIILRYQNQVVSVVVTESENTAGANSETANGAEAITCQPSGEGLQVACFKTAKYAIFVVSGLSESDNLTLARTISPAVRRHIAQAERRA